MRHSRMLLQVIQCFCKWAYLDPGLPPRACGDEVLHGFSIPPTNALIGDWLVQKSRIELEFIH